MLDTQKLLAVVWWALSLILLSLPILDLIDFNKETKDFRDTLEKVPSHKRALGLVYDPIGSPRQSAIYAYFPSWYQAIKGGWVDFNFAWFSPQIIRYKSGHLPESQLGFTWSPQAFSSFKNCNAYDLLIVKCSGGECDSHEESMTHSTCAHKIIYRNDRWSIYSL